MNSKIGNVLTVRAFRFTKSHQKIILEHLAMLKVCDLPINESVLDTISNQYGDYFNLCVSELELAKQTKLEPCWITFFDLLVHSRCKLQRYAGNKELVESFKRSGCLRRFPIYGVWIRKNLQKGTKMRRLIDESSIILSNHLPIFIPAHLIIRDVLDCVISNKDLAKLCQ